MKEKLISVREFARRAGISYNLARAAVANRQIPSIEIGRVRRIHEGALDAFLYGSPRKETTAKIA